MEQSAASINNVGHISFPFVLIGLEQGLAEPADDLAGIIAIQQKRANAVLAHRADAVAEHQPAGFGLNGRSAIAELDQFPRESRFNEQLAFVQKWTLSENMR